MAETDLEEIRKKVRRLTRSATEAQLSTTQIDQYVNTFVLYDFPEHLRLFSLREVFTFFTDPNVDQYNENNLSDFSPNIYISIHPPVYIAGYQSFFSQSREQFFRIYPLTNFIEQLGVGDGITQNFSGTFSNRPMLPNQVMISSINANNNAVTVSDDGNGILTGDGTGSINYVTGVFSVTFNVAPASAQAVNGQNRPYQAARPEALLYFDDTFILRPVPDQAYRVEVEVYRRPTELISSNQSPELNQWWQYIAYGAAKKVFEDRMDSQSILKIMPEFREQEALVLRKTISQITNERTATIYSEQITFPFGFNNRGVF